MEGSEYRRDGILPAASDPSAIVSSVEQAREAGILVIALDTPPSPADAADATFATDNFQAGVLIGQWAAAQLGDGTADAKIGMLNALVNQTTVDVARDQGFTQGFGYRHRGPDSVGRRGRPPDHRSRRHPGQRGGRRNRHGESPDQGS